MMNLKFFSFFQNPLFLELYVAPISIGLDLETGGHVFQLHFSNAKAFFDPGYIADIQGQWRTGDIYFGFGISRVFTIKKPKTVEE